MRSVFVFSLLGGIVLAGCAKNQRLAKRAPVADRLPELSAPQAPDPSLSEPLEASSEPANSIQLVQGILDVPSAAPQPQLVPANADPIEPPKLAPTVPVQPDPPAAPLAPESNSGPIPVAADSSAEPLALNLPTTLAMVGGQHPLVGAAQWRVREAYAQFQQAKVLWLPTLQPGISFHRHDGNYQASDSRIVDVNRNSFQYGLGTGATGAGTTPRPGVVAQFHLADMLFQPRITQKTAWARSHSATGVVNEQLLRAALAYLDLLEAHQDLQIITETENKTAGLAKLTRDFAAAGQGLQADADRLQTELTLVQNRLETARERAAIASARLAEALSLDTGQTIVPLDPTVVPIELGNHSLDKATLIATGLSNRPELKAAQALVAAACDRYRRQKNAPLIPSILLGYTSGGFGGGAGDDLDNVDFRYDFDAVVAWRVRNLGFGEQAARREANARLEQAKFEKIQILDRVARQVSEAHAQVTHRSQRISITQRAIQSAQDSYERNLSRIRDRQGLPLEVLQSLRALEDARRAYLESVVAHNEAQFRLQWSLGWPVSADAATATTVTPVE